jgi:hypothetical protein
MRRLPLADLDLAEYDSLLADLESDRATLTAAANRRALVTVAAAVDHVDRSQLDLRKQLACRQMEAENDRDAAAATRDLASFDAETAQMMATLKDDQATIKRALEDRHADERRAHLDDWQSDAHMRVYSYPSTQLIAHRKKLERLMTTRRYAMAEVCAQEIEALERKETAAAVELVKGDYRESRRVLSVRHSEEAAVLQLTHDSESQFVMQRRERDKAVLENVKRKVDVKRTAVNSPDKAWLIVTKHRMVDIARSHDPVRPRAPMGVIDRAAGRFAKQVSPLRLPRLNLERRSICLCKTTNCSICHSDTSRE